MLLKNITPSKSLPLASECRKYLNLAHHSAGLYKTNIIPDYFLLQQVKEIIQFLKLTDNFASNQY